MSASNLNYYDSETFSGAYKTIKIIKNTELIYYDDTQLGTFEDNEIKDICFMKTFKEVFIPTISKVSLKNVEDEIQASYNLDYYGITLEEKSKLLSQDEKYKLLPCLLYQFLRFLDFLSKHSIYHMLINTVSVYIDEYNKLTFTNFIHIHSVCDKYGVNTFCNKIIPNEFNIDNPYCYNYDMFSCAITIFIFITGIDTLDITEWNKCVTDQKKIYDHISNIYNLNKIHQDLIKVFNKEQADVLYIVIYNMIALKDLGSLTKFNSMRDSLTISLCDSFKDLERRPSYKTEYKRSSTYGEGYGVTDNKITRQLSETLHETYNIPKIKLVNADELFRSFCYKKSNDIDRFSKTTWRKLTETEWKNYYLSCVCIVSSINKDMFDQEFITQDNCKDISEKIIEILTTLDWRVMNYLIGNYRK